MTNGIRKPPVSIDELEDGGGPVREKGRLSYLDSNEDRRGRPKSRLDLTQAGLLVVISVAISFLLMVSMYLSKNEGLTLLTNQKDLQAKITGVETSLGGQVKRIDSVVNTMGEYAKKGELGGFADKTSLNNLSLQVSQATADLKGKLAKEDLKSTNDTLTSLQNKIKELETNLSTLTTKVNTQTTTTTTGQTPIGTSTTVMGVTIQVTYAPQSSVWSAGDYPFVLTITNTSQTPYKVFLEGTATANIGSFGGVYPSVDAASGFLAMTPIGDSTLFNNTWTPSVTNCFRIDGISKGFLLLGPGQSTTTSVSFKLVYAVGATNIAQWNVQFIPIVTGW